jgi:hypothetical protein
MHSKGMNLSRWYWLVLAITLILGCSIVGCKPASTDLTQGKEIFLQDSLFLVQVSIPKDLNNSYNWVHRSDNECSYISKYRFTDASYPVYKESGFFYKQYSDSCYQLTFSHIENYECQGAMGGDIWIRASSRKEWAASHGLDYTEYFEKDEEINGLPFSLVAYKMELGKNWKHQIVFISAITLIDDIPVSITGECLGSHCEEFVRRMEKVIKTVKITKLK